MNTIKTLLSLIHLHIFHFLPTLEASFENISTLMRLWTTWTFGEHVFLAIYQFEQS